MTFHPDMSEWPEGHRETADAVADTDIFELCWKTQTLLSPFPVSVKLFFSSYSTNFTEELRNFSRKHIWPDFRQCGVNMVIHFLPLFHHHRVVGDVIGKCQ